MSPSVRNPWPVPAGRGLSTLTPASVSALAVFQGVCFEVLFVVVVFLFRIRLLFISNFLKKNFFSSIKKETFEVPETLTHHSEFTLNLCDVFVSLCSFCRILFQLCFLCFVFCFFDVILKIIDRLNNGIALTLAAHKASQDA